MPAFVVAEVVIGELEASWLLADHGDDEGWFCCLDVEPLVLVVEVARLDP